MDDIVLKDVDREVLERVSEMASDNGRPIAQEINILLREAVAARDPRTRALWLARRAREIAAMTPHGVVQTDSTLLIREDRDRDF